MEGISTCDLPQIFRDAIYITRELGSQYIWIDSLCIVQDSVADWEEESAKMGTYYKLSWLTIGVGIESSKGCFGTREVRLDIVQYLKIVSDDPERSILYFTANPTTLSLGDDQESILRQRAWAFQEEVLSPRYLGFQPNQTFYRCGDYIHFEDGLLEWLYAPSLNRDVGGYPLKERNLQRADWFDFIQDYSSRALTKAEDRLPALSGIAHMYQEVWKEQYLAGL
jgi:hypothetical protein